MAKFNKKSPGTKTTNLAGGSAYKLTPELELTYAVLATFLEDKYYESGKDRMRRIEGLLPKVDHTYIAQLAYVARTEFHLRSVSHFLLAKLSEIHKSDGDGLVWRAVNKSVIRPDDILEIASLLDMKLPKQIKRGFRRALLKFDGYQLAKYRGEGKEVKMVDIFNVVHPKAEYATKEQKEAWEKLMKGELKITGKTWEAKVSQAGKVDTEGKTKEEVQEEKAKLKKEAWTDMVKSGKIGFMALLRNLNNLVKSGVDDETIDKAFEILTNKENVHNSKQLPFRFVTAYENVRGNRKLTDAISIAMDHSVDNVPKLAGRTLISIDSSGSMNGDIYRKAAIFAAALAKANDVDVITYSNSGYVWGGARNGKGYKELAVSSRTPIIDVVGQFEKAYIGGGTETGLTFQYATTKGKYDRVIVLTDEESWVESWGGDNVQKAYQDYRIKTAADPFVYMIDMTGYGTVDLQGGRVFSIAGWSNAVLDFIGKMEDGESIVKHIKAVDIYGEDKNRQSR